MEASESLFISSCTIDNNDGRQETMTGSGTTHDTNIMFQLSTKKEKEKLLPLSKEINTFQAESNELLVLDVKSRLLT